MIGSGVRHLILILKKVAREVSGTVRTAQLLMWKLKRQEEFKSRFDIFFAFCFNGIIVCLFARPWFFDLSQNKATTFDFVALLIFEVLG